MNLLIAILVGVIFAAAVYLLLGGELKGVCMGIFLIGHGANLALIAASGSPVGNLPPVTGTHGTTEVLADPLPQALILTAIVIGFAVQAFLLTLLVVTHRRTGTLDMAELAGTGEHDPTDETGEAS
ncbi:MAG: sodium:proton antiporter [Phycisphaeraceae bacterium]|nr:sodium:proton antiporter [Phycisphaeraceae bacterium]